MDIGLIAVMGLNFAVGMLLLMGTGRLCGFPCCAGRCLLAALVGALHAGGCMAPGFLFLGNMFWRTVILAVMAAIAYGIHATTFRLGSVNWVLNMAVGGVSYGLGKGSAGVVLGAALIFLVLHFFGWGRPVGRQYVPVELCYNGNRLKMTALQDTGNTLHDPLSGQPVLVVGSDAAYRLTGLTPEQLRNPVESICRIPGLRLIPYRTVGNEGGFLLGLRLRNVQVGSWCGSRIVAFAPQKLSVEGTYQALTGGIA